MLGAIIQARLGSTRLPAKVMLKLPSGECMLERIINQAKQSKYIKKVIIVSPKYDKLLESIVIGCGAEISFANHKARDVLAEYLQAIETYGLTTVVRITSDCPMLTTEIIDSVVKAHLDSGVDYTYNHHDYDGTKGDGVDVEVFEVKALYNTTSDYEHVTSNLRLGDSVNILNPPDIDSFSVNTLEDYIKLYKIMGEYCGST